LKTGGTSVPPVYFWIARRSTFQPQTVARQYSSFELPAFAPIQQARRIDC
jgi:hypothetical protein